MHRISAIVLQLDILAMNIMGIQWNPSNTDTLGTKIIVLISEVSLFQGENNMYLDKVGTRPGVLIKQGVLISEVSILKRGSTVFILEV